MPMNTTLVSRCPSAASRRDAKRTWSTISADLEVAPEAELAGRAERAADRAAGLARDAQRVPLARPRPRRVVHQDRFDERPVGQPMERLLGQAAVRLAQLGVGDRVEAERGVELRRAAAAGSVRISADAAASPPHTASRDLAGAVGGLATLDEPRRERSGVRPADPGRVGQGSRAVDASTRCLTAGTGRRCRRSAGDGRRRNSTQGIAPPPAGWTSIEHESLRRRRTPRPRAPNAPVARSLAVPPGSADQTVEPPGAGLDERARPRLIGADLALELGGRPRRVQPAVLAPQRPGQRRAARPAAAVAGARPAARRRASRPAASAAIGEPRLELRRRLVPVERRAGAAATIGPGVEPLVHPHQRHARSRRRRPGSSPGSASRRDGAAAATGGG